MAAPAQRTFKSEKACLTALSLSREATTTRRLLAARAAAVRFARAAVKVLTKETAAHARGKEASEHLKSTGRVRSNRGRASQRGCLRTYLA
eukprot:6188292-Pleurochrysis_carterae.AAC.3